MYWPQLMNLGRATDLQRFQIAACGCRKFAAIAVEMSARKLLGL